MLALIGYGLLGIVVAIGVVALLVLILPADHLGAAPRDVVPAGLPSRPEIGADDVARVRLPVTLRGYRMVDTDAVLDRLATELERRDQEIDDLRRRAGLSGGPAAAAGDPAAGEVLATTVPRAERGAGPGERVDGAAAGAPTEQTSSPGPDGATDRLPATALSHPVRADQRVPTTSQDARSTR